MNAVITIDFDDVDKSAYYSSWLSAIQVKHTWTPSKNRIRLSGNFDEAILDQLLESFE